MTFAGVDGGSSGTLKSLDSEIDLYEGHFCGTQMLLRNPPFFYRFWFLFHIWHNLTWEVVSPSGWVLFQDSSIHVNSQRFTPPQIAGLKVQTDPQHFLFGVPAGFFWNSGEKTSWGLAVSMMLERGAFFFAKGPPKSNIDLILVSYFYPILELHEHLGTSRYHT